MAEYRNNYRQRENQNAQIDRTVKREYFDKKDQRPLPYDDRRGTQNFKRQSAADKNQRYKTFAKEEKKQAGKESSRLYRKIMADETVGYVCDKNVNLIHDKSCELVKKIKDSNLKYLVTYPKWMNQCPKCAVEAYVRNGAKDFENIADYKKLVRLMKISDDMLRHVYVDCEMKTRANGNVLTVWYKEDTWKIVYLNQPGSVRLLHNNYHVENGKRVFEKSFHIQSDFTSNTKIKYAFENIETYSWDMHRFHEREARREQMRLEAEKKTLRARIRNAFSLLFHGNREDEFQNTVDASRKDDPTEFRLDVRDFNIGDAAGYPDNGSRCIYVWKTKNGFYQWQIGEYLAKKRQFVIRFSDQTFTTNWGKVVAWKYVRKAELGWTYADADEKNEE